MKKKEELAQKYAKEVWKNGSREYISMEKYSELDFIAGWDARQEEIDMLANHIVYVLETKFLKGCRDLSYDNIENGDGEDVSYHFRNLVNKAKKILNR